MSQNARAEVNTVGSFLRDYGTLILVIVGLQGTMWLGLAWGGYKLIEVIQEQAQQQEQISTFREQLPLIQYQIGDVAESVNAIKKKLGVL